MALDLVLRLRDGDEEAFRELFLSYVRVLISFVYGIVHDLPIAENIVQDVFVELWNRRRSLNPNSSIRPYLYTIAKNKAFKHLRHKDVERRHADETSQSDLFEPSPEHSVISEERIAAIHAAIDALPEKCKLVFKMNRFQDLSYAEIAEVLDISKKTVEAHMSRALRELRDKLGHLFVLLFL